MPLDEPEPENRGGKLRGMVEQFRIEGASSEALYGSGVVAQNVKSSLKSLNTISEEEEARRNRRRRCKWVIR